MYTRVMHYQGAYVHKIGFFLGFWLRRDSFLEPLKDKEDYKGNEHHRNDRGECFFNDVEKYAITTNNVSLTPSSHLIFASFFNIWFMSLVTLEKLGMNLLKTLAFPKKDCKGFLCVGRGLYLKLLFYQYLHPICWYNMTHEFSLRHPKEGHIGIKGYSKFIALFKGFP